MARAMLGVVVFVRTVDESKHQLERLCGFGCAEAQGYYFSSGVAAAEIDAVLARGPAQEAA